jgi:hypothetical protein
MDDIAKPVIPAGNNEKEKAHALTNQSALTSTASYKRNFSKSTN